MDSTAPLVDAPEDTKVEVAKGAESLFRQCPKCAQPSLIRQEGCDVCKSCGYSKCG